MGTPGHVYSKVNIINTIKQFKGNINKAAKHMECTRNVFYDWIYKDEEVANTLKEVRERQHQIRNHYEEDHFEEAFEGLMEKLEERDIPSIHMVMKRWYEKNKQTTSGFNVRVVNEPWPHGE